MRNSLFFTKIVNLDEKGGVIDSCLSRLRLGKYEVREYEVREIDGGNFLLNNTSFF